MSASKRSVEYLNFDAIHDYIIMTVEFISLRTVVVESKRIIGDDVQPG